MEAAVLDEDGPRIEAADQPTRHEQARHVGLHRFGIEQRLAALAEPDARAFEQVEIRVIAGQQQDGVGRHFFAVARRMLHDRRRRSDLHDA